MLRMRMSGVLDGYSDYSLFVIIFVQLRHKNAAKTAFILLPTPGCPPLRCVYPGLLLFDPLRGRFLSENREY